MTLRPDDHSSHAPVRRAEPVVAETRTVRIELLHASSIHRFEGRPAHGPLPAVGPESREEIQVRAGLGIVGDRHFNKPAHRAGSVTVMTAEAMEHVANTLELRAVPDAGATRRNVIVRGMDIDAMRGAVFSLDSGSGPVVLRAGRPANPCAWMNVVLAEGAHRALRGRGGMRCEPLSDGTLRLGSAELRILEDTADVTADNPAERAR